ncbi:MAG: CHAT domain-containing protein, partial [Bacteroidota bacterium]
YDPEAPVDFERVNDHALLLNSFVGLAECHIARYQDNQEMAELVSAADYMTTASELIDFLRIRFETIGSKLRLFEQAHTVYERAIEISLELHQTEPQLRHDHKALAYAEKSKAILLLEGLQKSDAEVFAGVPKEKISAIRALENQIGQQEKMRYFETRSGGKDSQQKADSLSALILDEKIALANLVGDLESSYPEYFQLRYQTMTLPVEWIQAQLLADDETLIEYFLGEKQLHIFVINRADFQVRSVALPAEFRNWTRYFNEAIRSYPQVPTAQLDQMIQQYNYTAYWLFQILLEPVQDILKSKLIVITDGELGLLPFGALLSAFPEREKAFGSHPYLIHNHAFSYNYSISLLKEMRERKRQQPNQIYLGMAPDFERGNANNLSALRHNKSEVKMVQQLLGGKIFTGTGATRNRFLELQQDYRILHLATHGKVNLEAEDYSYLAFSDYGDVDRSQQVGLVAEPLLFVKDLYGVQTNADLVVLSACETGTGALQKGEGIASIARSFSYAGAGGLLATQWSVDDKATNELVHGFFQQLQLERKRDEALQEAQQAFIAAKADHRAHPFYWASFISIGDNRPIDIGSSWRSAWQFLLLFAFVGGIWGLWQWWRSGSSL